MNQGVCPACQSQEIYRSDFAPLQAGDSLVRLYNLKGNDIAIELYLCANCGHIELGVPESQRAKLIDLVKTDKWHKVVSA